MVSCQFLPVNSYPSLLTRHFLPVTSYSSILTRQFLPVYSYPRQFIYPLHCCVTYFGAGKRKHNNSRTGNWAPLQVDAVLTKRHYNWAPLQLDAVIHRAKYFCPKNCFT